MFTPIGKVGNQYQLADETTGQPWGTVSEQLYNDMLRSGSIKPGTMANNMGGGGGGGLPSSAGLVNSSYMDQAPPPNQNFKQATPTAPAAPKLTVVPPSQPKQQPQQQQVGYNGKPLVELVRTPGTAAQWQNQSRSRSGIDQGLQDNLMELELDNRRKALEANNAMYETSLQRANAESINAQRERMMAEQELKRKQVEDAERNAYAQNVTKKLQQDVEDVRTQKLSTWHQDVGMGGTILAAISMAMGAYAQGINGGPNSAADIINRAIDRDTQKKLSEKQDRLDSAQQKLQNSMTEFGFNAGQRKQYMTALGQQQAAAYLRQQAADKELAFAHPTMLQNAAALEAQSNQTLTELAKTAQYNATERWVPASGGGLVARLTPEGKLAQAESEIRGTIATAKGKEADTEKKMRDVSGQTAPENAVVVNGKVAGIAQNAKRWDQVQSVVDGSQEMNDTIELMIGNIDAGGSPFPNKNDDDYNRRMITLGRAAAKSFGETVKSDEDAKTFGEKMQAEYTSVSLTNPERQKAFFRTWGQDAMQRARLMLRRNGMDDSVLTSGTSLLTNTE